MFCLFVLLTQAEASFEQVVSVTWQRAPMREVLMQFAKANRVGLFIDRRIDPAILINFKAEKKTVKTVFQDFANSAGFYCHFFGSVVYIGNGDMREILPRVIAEHRKFFEQVNTAKNKNSANARVKLRKMATVKLPMLSEPRKILNNLAQQNQFTWQNLEKLQHDVWDENSTLPSMQLGDFLILMLIGFDLDYVCELPEKDSSGKMILRIIDVRNFENQTDKSIK
ncbi:MAG: hypothetical protein LBJ00_05905 [Planctomycetaceae bacterium]|nr:hypothetical protein [Planctomycetaceae bacterium]